MRRAAHGGDGIARELGVAQQTRGYVDRKRERPAGIAQAFLIRDGGAKHPFCQRADMAGLFGHRHEQIRRDHAAIGMLPAHQSFGAFNAAGAEIVFRLVQQRDVAGIEGAAHIAHQREIERRIAVSAMIEQRHLLASGTRLIERDARAFDHAGRRFVLGARLSDADADIDVDVLTFERKRLFKIGGERVADFPSVGLAVGEKRHAHYVAGKPRHRCIRHNLR